MRNGEAAASAVTVGVAVVVRSSDRAAFDELAVRFAVAPSTIESWRR